MRKLHQIRWVWILSAMWFCGGIAYGQNQWDEIRDNENRVRFTHPDSILIWVRGVDSNTVYGKALHTWAQGTVLFHHSDYSESYKILSRALEQARETRNFMLQSEISMDLARAYMILDMTGESLSLLLYVRDYFNRAGTNHQKARVLLALGELYRKMSYFEKAQNALAEGLKWMNGEESQITCALYNRMAAINTQKGILDSADYYSRIAIEMAQKLNDAHLQAISYNEIGQVNMQSGDWNAAFLSFKKADSLWTSLNMLRFAAPARLKVSIILATRKETDTALAIATHTFFEIRGKKWYFLESEMAQHIANLYMEANMADSAFRYQDYRYGANNAFIETRYKINADVVQSRYQYEKNLNTIREQTRQLKEESQNRRWYTVLVIILAAMAVMLALLAAQKQKESHLIKKEKQQEVLHNRSLQESIHEKNALIQEVNHRVKNNLQTISSLIDLQKASISDQAGIWVLEDAQRRIDSMGLAHELLFSSSSLGKINVAEYMEKLIQAEQSLHGAQVKNIRFLLDVFPAEIDLNRIISLGMITSEAVSNAVKHAFDEKEDKVLRVTLTCENEKCELRIQDNGKGLAPEFREKAKSSFGIRLMEIFAKKMGARFELEDAHPGTAIVVLFSL
ncbi:MAG: sensor histidine kinase [Flavobacteriales bacterium]|nr:sensor histidine kinase [Flavobacteriales bacterium]